MDKAKVTHIVKQERESFAGWTCGVDISDITSSSVNIKSVLYCDKLTA